MTRKYQMEHPDRPSKRITRQHSSTVITEDGVVKQVDINQTFLVDKEPDFVKVYLNDIMQLSNLPKSSNKVLMALLAKTNYQNEIILHPLVRKEVCAELSIAEVTFRKAVDQFVETGILTKKASNYYIANPYLFGKGSWENIRKIRLLVEYNEHGRFLIREDIEGPGLGSSTRRNDGNLAGIPMWNEQPDNDNNNDTPQKGVTISILT